jgi:hypothetical protein
VTEPQSDQKGKPIKELKFETGPDINFLDMRFQFPRDPREVHVSQPKYVADCLALADWQIINYANPAAVALVLFTSFQKSRF